jgi:protein disulfide-isomerase A1
LIAEYGRKYKKRAWFAVAKDFSEDMMVAYDFDKVPALVAIHPKYKEQSLFYGPFEGICYPFLVVRTGFFLL